MGFIIFKYMIATLDEGGAIKFKLGRDARKPVFGVSDIARLKPACSATETS